MSINDLQIPILWIKYVNTFRITKQEETLSTVLLKQKEHSANFVEELLKLKFSVTFSASLTGTYKTYTRVRCTWGWHKANGYMMKEAHWRGTGSSRHEGQSLSPSKDDILAVICTEPWLWFSNSHATGMTEFSTNFKDTFLGGTWSNLLAGSCPQPSHVSQGHSTCQTYANVHVTQYQAWGLLWKEAELFFGCRSRFFAVVTRWISIRD